MALWHAARVPFDSRRNGGNSSKQALGLSFTGQRGWKAQPLGGLIGLGTSPSSTVRSRLAVGSGLGTADSNALVYGCFGSRYSVLESVSSTIEKYIATKIVGQNLFNINRILAIIDANLAKVTCAKEGIDLALHDLVGKVLNVPVHTLLGGCFREEIAIASEIGIDKPEVMAENALDILKLGIKVIKIKGSNEMGLDVKRIKAVREAVGDGVELRLDPNAAWTTPGTIKAMKEVEGCNLQLLEQPVPGWDLKGMAHIRNSIGIPLMADESIWTPQDVIKIAE